MANRDVSIRVPNLPLGPMVDKDGNPTQNEQLFRQSLIDLLQLYFSPEGIVAPSQSPANVQVIKAGVDASGQSTMLPGTVIYQKHATDYTQDKVIIAFRSSNVDGAAPTLYYINVTAL